MYPAWEKGPDWGAFLSSPMARAGVLLSIGAVALVSGSLATGWWLGQRNAPRSSGAEASAQRQIALLQERLASGTASSGDQQQLLQLLLVSGNQGEATLVLERLADQEPERWQVRLLLAELRRNNNNRSGAERELRQILNLQPDRIEALQLLTVLQLEQGRGSEAQTQLKALMERYSKPSPKPQVLPIGLLLADLQQQQGQQQQAVATYSKLAGDFPRDPRPLLALALLKQEQGDTKGAQETMAQARSRQPENKDPRLDRVAANWGIASLESSKEPSPKASTTPVPAAPTP
ncbi:MAG: hypothetical protein RLZZ32_1586 [Cyanobacteriota bacterium]